MNLLVADIGGTNVRFCFQKTPNDEITLVQFFKCNDFEQIEDAINFYISIHKLNVEHFSLSIAGPCGCDEVNVTNNNWKFSKIKLLEKFKLISLLTVNDFVAQGLGLSKFIRKSKTLLSNEFLAKYKIKLIKKGKALLGSNVLIIGPGTGLGMCTLTPVKNDFLAIEGEGGNVHFSPANKVEIELLTSLLDKKKYVSSEDLLSGRGLQNIYKFLTKETEYKFFERSSEEIGKAALEGDKTAIKAVKIMFEILGTSIANNILVNGCQRAVVICGGMSSKLYSLLVESNFLQSLKNKGHYSSYVGNVPIYLSLDETNGLKGAVEAFHHPLYQEKVISGTESN